MDALTALEATLTMRPKPRYAMSVMLARISSMGMSMLACTACCQAAVSNWRKSSGGGPPALGAAMPKSCRAAKTAACLCPMVMSAATGGTRPPAAALACKAAAPKAATTTFTLHAPGLRTTQARPGPALCWLRTRAPICPPASHLRSLFLSSHCLFAGLSDPAPATAPEPATAAPAPRHRPQHGFPESEGLAREPTGALLRPWAQPGVSIRQSTSAPGSNQPSGMAGMQRHANHVTRQMCPDTRLANTA